MSNNPEINRSDVNEAKQVEEKMQVEDNKSEQEQISLIIQENAELKDRFLRTLAEMENLRRRSEREVHDAKTYAVTKFALDMIGTADNLQRALDAISNGDSLKDGDNATLKSLLDGVELTERELLKALERHGVKKRFPKGERFDPHKDQVIFEVPDETKPNGTVIEVVQVGYTIGDRVLRPAMVGISKGSLHTFPNNHDAAGDKNSSTNQSTKSSFAKPGDANSKVDRQA